MTRFCDEIKHQQSRYRYFLKLRTVTPCTRRQWWKLIEDALTNVNWN
jgi:hypothetical protein